MDRRKFGLNAILLGLLFSMSGTLSATAKNHGLLARFRAWRENKKKQKEVKEAMRSVVPNTLVLFGWVSDFDTEQKTIIRDFAEAKLFYTDAKERDNYLANVSKGRTKRLPVEVFDAITKLYGDDVGKFGYAKTTQSIVAEKRAKIEAFIRAWEAEKQEEAKRKKVDSLIEKSLPPEITVGFGYFDVFGDLKPDEKEALKIFATARVVHPENRDEYIKKNLVQRTLPREIIKALANIYGEKPFEVKVKFGLTESKTSIVKRKKAKEIERKKARDVALKTLFPQE